MAETAIMQLIDASKVVIRKESGHAKTYEGSFGA